MSRKDARVQAFQTLFQLEIKDRFNNSRSN